MYGYVHSGHAHNIISLNLEKRRYDRYIYPNCVSYSFIHSLICRWLDNHDHLTNSLKHIINQTNIIVFGALMFVNRVTVLVIAGGEGKPLVLRHL